MLEDRLEKIFKEISECISQEIQAGIPVRIVDEISSGGINPGWNFEITTKGTVGAIPEGLPDSYEESQEKSLKEYWK